MTPISEIIFSGFVSKVVNDIIDVSKDKIRRAVRNRNTKHQSIESQIYNVIVDMLNKITNNQDSIYDAAEVLLKSFKENDGDELESIRSCLQVLDSTADKNNCMKFKVSLYEELSKEGYSELFRAILLLLLDQKNRYDNAVYEQLNQKLDEVILMLNQKKDQNNNVQRKIKSKTKEYEKRWNDNMFLNDFNKRDKKNIGKNITLREMYIPFCLPPYTWYMNDEKDSEYDLKDVLIEYVEGRRENNKMLLILGQPGIGKSTLITWILNNIINNIDEILVYQFASDLINVKWENIERRFSLADRIIKALNLSYKKLNGKVLILDGFDEISIGSERTIILNQLYFELMKGSLINNFSLLITCRENYIQDLSGVKCDYITLQPWNAEQMQSFCSIYKKKAEIEISNDMMKRMIENKNIFGIPLILYMVLALNISIEKDDSIVDVYDQIFSLDGGIYERCLQNKNYENPHWIRNIKEQIHLISKEIAIWIFENKPEEAYIPQYNYNKIVDEIAKKSKYYEDEIKQSFKIGNFFKEIRHCEGSETEKLYFVHRSIYEYFVAEAIYSSIENSMLLLSDKSQEELAANIATYLKEGVIAHTIGEYLKHKILKLYNKLDIKKQELFYRWWEKSIEKMMYMGMFYYTKKELNYVDIIKKEIKCFINFIEILRLIYDVNGNVYILENVNRVSLSRYIKHSIVECIVTYVYDIEIDNTKYVLDLSKLDLKNTILAGYYLSRVNLEETDLKFTDLSRIILRKANLRGANLRGANLRGADLCGADLNEADLEKANLEASIWYESDIQKALSQLKVANFTYLMMRENNKVKVVGRSELFLDENY